MTKYSSVLGFFHVFFKKGALPSPSYSFIYLFTQKPQLSPLIRCYFDQLVTFHLSVSFILDEFYYISSDIGDQK